jgi:hypothetical protein
MQDLINKALATSLSYPEYRQLLTDLLATGKTTGENHSPFYLQITDLNQHRMERLDRKPRLAPEMTALLQQLKKPYRLLVLTEGWCGDAAQIVPIFQWMAVANPLLDLRIVLRDEHLELIDLFLTDGGRGIPKLLILDAESNALVGEWGPRPAPAQKMALAYKYHPAPKPNYDEYNKALHTWYARDKTLTTQTELLEVLQPLL